MFRLFHIKLFIILNASKQYELSNGNTDGQTIYILQQK